MTMTVSSVRVRIRTDAGPLAIVGTERGVTEIYFDGASAVPKAPAVKAQRDLRVPEDIPTPVRVAIEQLEEYLRGERTTFDFDMHYTGTAFQRRVWSYLLTIPPGETRTYGQVAQALGKPKGARAVGGAVGSNPISIVIPCHRVVAADGSGGGYGGGMEAKRFLLQIEGVSLGEVRSN